MSASEGRTARIGVSELRRNLSKYLKRVKEGETFIITEWGHEIARLVPLPVEQP
jgi:prevent-host-death family protein